MFIKFIFVVNKILSCVYLFFLCFLCYSPFSWNKYVDFSRLVPHMNATTNGRLWLWINKLFLDFFQSILCNYCYYFGIYLFLLYLFRLPIHKKLCKCGCSFISDCTLYCHHYLAESSAVCAWASGRRHSRTLGYVEKMMLYILYIYIYI